MMIDPTLANSDPPQQIKLPDGRSLAFSAYGDPGGNPILFFHGWPGARLQGRLTDQPAKRLGLRVIAPDRPGFGHSDFQRNRQILYWPDDVGHLADSLGIDKFSVIGLSGGAPYAFACAYKHPNRINSVGVVSGVGPSDVPGSDENILPLTGKMQAEAIPNCTAKFLPNEGHYSVYINHVDEILQEFIS